MIPAYRGRRPKPVLLRVGLFLYDVLSKKALPRRVWLRADAVSEREPRLARADLAGAGMYYDAWTDDARFVLALVRQAAREGAEVANYVEVTELIREDERILGAQLLDRIDSSAIDVRARVVVNATGVWLDEMRLPRTFPTIRPTKGTHIFLPRAKVGNRHAVALTTKTDGRLVFVLPWNDMTLVGTTDTDFRGDPNRVTPDAADVGYLLEATNDAFPDAHVGFDDVVSAYAGLRPLLRRGREERSESEISREHEVFLDPDGLISVAGGKFTTHRAMAEAVADMVEIRLGERRRNATSESMFGPPVRPLEEFLALGFDEPSALDLQGRYPPDQVARYVEAPEARDPIVNAIAGGENKDRRTPVALAQFTQNINPVAIRQTEIEDDAIVGDRLHGAEPICRTGEGINPETKIGQPFDEGHGQPIMILKQQNLHGASKRLTNAAAA